ncbi:glycosyltransferase family 2 protein [Salegentibacter sp.]|uniref:glycosyltransferase n=1 Tax=Salegentibacter sp. TaxID=1903072 RepID=UPI0035665DB0
MNFYIVIPAHNEAQFIGKTLQSLVRQSLPAKKIVVVNDGSTDATPEIVLKYAEENPEISLVHNFLQDPHEPGAKVIKAFRLGLETLDDNYDIICKFDADLIFPEDYLEKIAAHFRKPEVGMAGGFCSIKQGESWELENLTGKDHIRGALKAYKKDCFNAIGGLKPAMGWDTVDELLAQYHGWKIKTDKKLVVKHLKPTGTNYNKSSKNKQGEAFYSLRYGLVISIIASAKLALKKEKTSYFKDYLQGYFKAKNEKQPFLVNEEEGQFIRKLRWKKMRSKLF